MESLTHDDLTFSVRRSGRRRTLEITVDRDGELRLAAPEGAPDSAMREFVDQKRFWIYKKLAEKAELRHEVPKKRYVNGEGFLYLGRSYRLKLVESQEEPLKLVNGRFQLKRELADAGRKHFIAWYTRRGQAWLHGKVTEHAPRLNVHSTEVRVQGLGYRWGSCGRNNRLYFHWKTILLPRPIAEYVVVHELVHLVHPHHTPTFWLQLERLLPDYERKKHWLAANGIGIEGL